MANPPVECGGTQPFGMCPWYCSASRTTLSARAATSWRTWFCRSVRIARNATAVMASATAATAPPATRMNRAFSVSRILIARPAARSRRRARCAPGAVAPGLELAAQEGDEHLQRVGGGGLAVAPDPVHDHVVAEHLLRVADEQLEQGELDLREAEFGVAPADRPGGEVEGQVGVAEHVAGRLRAAQQRVHPGHQLAQRERLDQVVVGARVQARHPVIDRVPGGEHQDRRAVPSVAQGAAGAEPVEHRHEHVEDDQVDRRPGDRFQRFRPVDRRRDLIAGVAEGTAERVAHVRVIVYDQHSCLHG